MTAPVLPAFSLPMVLLVGAHLFGGAGLGLIYFRGLWWNAQLLARGGATALAVVFMIGRFALLAGVLTAIASIEGWALLLATALGLLAVRFVVVRRVAGAPA